MLKYSNYPGHGRTLLGLHIDAPQTQKRQNRNYSLISILLYPLRLDVGQLHVTVPTALPKRVPLLHGFLHVALEQALEKSHPERIHVRFF